MCTVSLTVADPEFLRGGAPTPISPENCMKIKKFWSRGGSVPRAPLEPPLPEYMYTSIISVKIPVTYFASLHLHRQLLSKEPLQTSPKWNCPTKRTCVLQKNVFGKNKFRYMHWNLTSEFALKIYFSTL